MQAFKLNDIIHISYLTHFHVTNLAVVHMDCMASLLVNYAKNYDFCKENKDYFEVNVDYYADSDDLDILVAGLKGVVCVLLTQSILSRTINLLVINKIIQIVFKQT